MKRLILAALIACTLAVVPVSADYQRDSFNCEVGSCSYWHSVVVLWDAFWGLH